MMTLRELIATASKSAELVFRKDSEIAPLYHMLKPDGTSLIWSPAVSGLGDKDEIVAAARMIMRELQIARYVFIDEAWILETKTRTPQEMAEVERFCQEFGARAHPDRREILMFAAESRDGEQLIARRYILRPERGKPTLSPLKYWSEELGGKMRGRMAGLLQE